VAAGEQREVAPGAAALFGVPGVEGEQELQPGQAAGRGQGVEGLGGAGQRRVAERLAAGFEVGQLRRIRLGQAEGGAEGRRGEEADLPGPPVAALVALLDLHRAALQQALEQAVGEHRAGGAGAGQEVLWRVGLSPARRTHSARSWRSSAGQVSRPRPPGGVGPAQALALQAGALRVGQAQAADAVAVGRAPAVVSPALVRHGAGSARWAGPSRRRVSSCG
jgi:hypothetical protein